MKLNLILYKIAHTTLRAAAALLLCAGLWGCSDGRDHVVSEPAAAAEEAAPERDVWLSLRVSVPEATSAGVGSRANDAAGHPDEAATAAESRIDCTGSGLSLMFFDDKQLLWRVLNPEEMTVEPAGTVGSYILRFKINSGYFAYAGSTGDVACSYMLVANLGGTASGSTFSTDDLLTKTPAQIAAMYAGFEMPDQSSAAWLPSETENRLIPMSGIARCTINRESFNNSTSAASAADMGSLYLQRALAKIRILDAVPQQQGEAIDFEQITAVTLEGVNTRGAYIPVGTSEWFNGTVDVETATELPDWFASTGRIKMHNEAQTSTVEGKTYQNAFVCYLPECKLTDRRAKMIFTVKERGSNRTRNFEVLLAEPSGSFAGIQALARNHIYEFKVEMSTISRPQLTYTVCDWNSYTVTPPTFN